MSAALRTRGAHGIGLLVVVAVPWLIVAGGWHQSYLFQIGCLIAIYIVAAISETVIAGFGGQLSFGQGGFMAVGAYTTAILSTRAGLSWWEGVLAGVAASVLVAALLGVVTLRLRGPYFVMATLAFAGIVYTVATNWLALTGGPSGISNVPLPTIGSIDFTDNTSIYYLLWAVTIMVIAAAAWFRSTWLGTSLLAIRDDELAAGAIGVRTTLVKGLAFLFSAAIAGLAGTMLAHFIGYVSPDTFAISQSVLIVTQVLVGGIDRISGAIVGVVVLMGLDQVLQSYAQVQTLLNGVVLLIAVLLVPSGLVGVAARFRPRTRAAAV